MGHPNPPPEHQMMQWIVGKWISKPIHAAATLGLTDRINAGTGKVTDLADATGTQPGPLYRLLRALACVGIYAETEPGEFINTPLSDCLVDDRLKPVALMFHSDWHDRAWDQLLYSIRTGKPAFDHVFGAPAYDWFDRHPEADKQFQDANARKAATTHSRVADCFDFTNVTTVADIGGGDGSLMIAILERHPHLTGTVVERPETAHRARQRIADHGLEKRLSIAAGDIFQAIPGGNDVYILSHVLHNWPDPACARILLNCRKAMGADTRLVILEAVIPSGNGFAIAKWLDLEVLVMGGGCERQAADFRSLLSKADMQLRQLTPLDDSLAMLECVPR